MASVTCTARGTPSRGYDNAWLASTTPSPAQAVALPAANFASTRHDAFGRAIETTERDGAVARVAYRALETITSDSLDLGLHGDSSVPTHAMVFQGTSTRARMDGHERVYDQVLHQAYDLGASMVGTEYHRLFTTYRADGVATSVTRAETASASVSDRTPVSGRALVRTFDYDSLGRRLSSLDPDADARSGSATVRHWRYLFSRTGDLVAVRDPRGCGQNFYYDWAGRLLAEDYVGCGEAQASGQDGEPLPAHAMSLDLAHHARRRRLVRVRRRARLGRHDRGALGHAPAWSPHRHQRPRPALLRRLRSAWAPRVVRAPDGPRPDRGCDRRHALRRRARD